MGLEGWGRGLSGFSEFGKNFQYTPGAKAPGGATSGATAGIGAAPSSDSGNPFAGIFPTLGNVTFGSPDLMEKYQMMQLKQKLSGGNTTLKDLMLMSQIEKNKAMTQKYLRGGSGGGRKGGDGGSSFSMPSLKDM